MMGTTLNLIASYAKSGSNWTRMVLENYLVDGDAPVDIWKPHLVANGFARSDFEWVMGVSSLHLNTREVDDLMPRYLSEALDAASEPLFFKIHCLNDGLFAAGTLPRVRVVYLIRNPLDVAVSHSHHFEGDTAAAVARLSREEAMYNDPSKYLGGLLPIRSGTWSHHVSSWTSDPPFPVEVLRYEDMLADPETQFARMIRLFFGEVDQDRLRKAIAFSAFDALKAQERSGGRAFHKHRGESFFRKGQADTWKQELTPDQVEAICSQHAGVMRRFGYQ